jgi:hypothetical protein
MKNNLIGASYSIQGGVKQGDLTNPRLKSTGQRLFVYDFLCVKRGEIIFSSLSTWKGKTETISDVVEDAF